jgi:anti-sigma factor (TIGR02949 family)
MRRKRDPCSKVIQKMYLILEEEKSESLCETLQTHMDECEACAKQYKTLEDLVSLCKRFPREEIPEDQKQRMKQALLKAL